MEMVGDHFFFWFVGIVFMNGHFYHVNAILSIDIEYFAQRLTICFGFSRMK